MLLFPPGKLVSVAWLPAVIPEELKVPSVDLKAPILLSHIWNFSGRKHGFQSGGSFDSSSFANETQQRSLSHLSDEWPTKWRILNLKWRG